MYYVPQMVWWSLFLVAMAAVVVSYPTERGIFEKVSCNRRPSRWLPEDMDETKENKLIYLVADLLLEERGATLFLTDLYYGDVQLFWNSL